jgi:hypothetical protein
MRISTMKPPRISIAELGLVAVLVAIDCALLRDESYAYQVAVVEMRGTLFMANVLAVCFYRLLRSPGARSPFLVGFSTAGVVSAIAFLAACRMAPEAMIRAQALHLAAVSEPWRMADSRLDLPAAKRVVSLAFMVVALAWLALPLLLPALVAGRSWSRLRARRVGRGKLTAD